VVPRRFRVLVWLATIFALGWLLIELLLGLLTLVLVVRWNGYTLSTPKTITR
jgi:hypothetical protein